MPREQITHNRIVEHVPDEIVSVETPRRNVHVAWNRGPAGWVQIAIDVPLAELREMLALAEREADAAAKANAHFGEYAVDAHPFRIVSDVLDRAEVNATIATLRRARDAAYGKDA